MLNKETIENAEILWNYHHLNQKLEKADLIIGFGGHDIRVAERSAELYLQEYAPKILFTGGSEVKWRVDVEKNALLTEAERFANRAIELGVPKEDILLEKESTNTGENISLSKEILKEHNTKYDLVIAVNQPYMERRTSATLQAQWKDLNFVVTSPQSTFIEYTYGDITHEAIIQKMMGDLYRIIEYPKKGFQTKQDFGGTKGL